MERLRVTMESPVRPSGCGNLGIPKGLSRFCISSSDRYARVYEELATILLNIEPRDAQIVLEFEELWTRRRKWIGLEHKRVVDLEKTGQIGSVVRFDDANRDVVYQEHHGYFCSLLSTRDKVVDYLRIMDAAEFYITYWRNTTPVALLSAAGKVAHRHASLYFLENIGPFDPVVFLSRSQVHMAIVVRDTVLARNIQGYLGRYELDGHV